MRLPFVSRRYAQGAIAVATAGLRADLEATRAELAEVRTAARRLPQTEAEMLAADLQKRVRELLDTVDQLRRGVVDDAQTVELRRKLAVEQRANRALEQRVYELTLANQLHDQQLHAKEHGA